MKFIAPFCLWMFMFRDFLSGRIPLNMDSTTIYSVTKFYFNNILNGVVPLWDPFVLMGTPFYAITLCNLFNPVTQLVPLLKLLGVNYYHAFITYMVVYYFTGAVGFYCLGKILFKDRRAAYIGYLLLLFSGIGASMFNQLTIVELFVPAVWFFVFLLRFSAGYKVSDFLGFAFSGMILAISYIPFYFATLLLFTVVLGIVLFFKEFKSFMTGLWAFVRRHMFLVILCVIGQLIAFAPLVVYKMIDSSKDVVSPSRHCNYSDIADCYERTLNEEGGMSYRETTQGGGLAERVHWRGLFNHLDKASYAIDQFFYIPVLAYVVIILSAFVAVDRTKLFLALLAVLLSLVGMGEAAPLHKFLYDRIFFFKYFRNLFFFESYIMPIIILYAVGQLKSLWEWTSDNFSKKKAVIFWLVVGHGGLFAFMMSQEGTIVTSLVSVAASFVLFLAAYLGRSSKIPLLFGGFAIAVLIQPVEVYFHYARNAMPFQCVLPGDHVRPQFSWTRPTEEAKSECKIFKFVPYEQFYDSMSMKDSRAFVGYPTSVTRGVFLLSQWVEAQTLINFASHKFWMYDNVRVFNEAPLELRSLTDVFNSRANAAYVSADNQGQAATFTPEDWKGSPAEILDSSKAKVGHFDVNRLKLTVDVPEKKFLVYTDGFTKHWNVTVNGREEKLIRAQGAFKGVWLSPGKNSIEFRYEPPGGGWIYLLVTVSLLLFGAAVVATARRERNWPWMETGA